MVSSVKQIRLPDSQKNPAQPSYHQRPDDDWARPLPHVRASFLYTKYQKNRGYNEEKVAEKVDFADARPSFVLLSSVVRPERVDTYEGERAAWDTVMNPVRKKRCLRLSSTWRRKTNLIQKMPLQVHPAEIPPPSNGPRTYEMERVMPTSAPTISGLLGPCSRRQTCAKL